LNTPEERLKEKCPGCQNWGKGHVIDIVTKKEVCTAELCDKARLQEVAEEMQKDGAGRVASWRVCSESYSPARVKRGFLRGLLKRSKNKRYCPMCGSKIPDGTLGHFCSMECAVKYIEQSEEKNDEAV
jgi:predicted nucleic acid-binding Zn ribbon protein